MIEILKLLLVGLYNHGEVIYLETKWTIHRWRGAYIHHHAYGTHPGFDGWMEIMPKHGMLRYCDYRGSVTWRYSVVQQTLLNGKPAILRFKGWELKPDPIGEDSVQAIFDAIDQGFYHEVDSFLDSGGNDGL